MIKKGKYLFVLHLTLVLLVDNAFAFTYQLSGWGRTRSTTLSSTEVFSSPFEILKEASVINPSTGATCNALDGVIVPQGNYNPASFLGQLLGTDSEYTLVIVMPQLGDFDSAEYAEMLSAVQDDLKKAKIALRIIGIGDETSAKRFASFSGLDLDLIRMDKRGKLHRALNLHCGPDWDVPSFVPNAILEWFAAYVGAKGNNNGDIDTKAIARSWLNYMAMCAGIAAPDTLAEIFRGYVGDKNAPERVKPTEVVTVGNKDDPVIGIKGVTNVKIGPFEYEQLWKNESGYQRPVELATVRLRIMVEVLSNFRDYVPDQRFLDLRGATFLFGKNGDEILYEHIDTGVLSYSKTMQRPLSYLEPYIGKKALNPLQLGDPVES